MFFSGQVVVGVDREEGMVLWRELAGLTGLDDWKAMDEGKEDGQEMVGRVTLKLLQEPFVKTGSNGRRSGIWGGVGEKGQISPSQTC